MAEEKENPKEKEKEKERTKEKALRQTEAPFKEAHLLQQILLLQPNPVRVPHQLNTHQMMPPGSKQSGRPWRTTGGTTTTILGQEQQTQHGPTSQDRKDTRGSQTTKHSQQCARSRVGESTRNTVASVGLLSNPHIVQEQISSTFRSTRCVLFLTWGVHAPWAADERWKRLHAQQRVMGSAVCRCPLGVALPSQILAWPM